MAEQTREEKNRDRKEFWESHIKAWGESGLTQIEYCNRHELSRHRFTYWKCKVYKKTEPVKFVPVGGDLNHSQLCRINRSSINLIARGYQIEIGDGFSPDTLSSLLRTLERL